MTDLILALKLVHIVGATVLFGTGIGIAFFMMMAHLTRDAANVAATARIVVIADAVFTATAVVVQPMSGAALAWLIGYSLWESWLAVSIACYVLIGLCWLPAVCIQIKLRDLARTAAAGGTALPPRYHRLFWIWFALGWPAFIGMLAIFAMMVWKPRLW